MLVDDPFSPFDHIMAIPWFVQAPDMARAIQQAGVLALRDEQICLVTSRSGARWVIPKGRIESHQTPLEAARQEVWEEAGLVGEFHPQAVGRFAYSKWDKDYEVTVFQMSVRLEATIWPEKDLRVREWVSVREAILRLVEPELRQLLASLFLNRVD